MTTSWLHCTTRPTCSACYGAGLKRISAPISILHPNGPLHKGGAGRTARAGCYTGLSNLVTAASPPTQILRHNNTGAASDRVERHSRT